MTIDSTGTAPGLVSTPLPEVNMRCTKSPCDSNTFTENQVKVAEMPGLRFYTCTKCGHRVSICVGGAFDPGVL